MPSSPLGREIIKTRMIPPSPSVILLAGTLFPLEIILLALNLFMVFFKFFSSLPGPFNQPEDP